MPSVPSPQEEREAQALLAALRWSGQPRCPFCGATQVYHLGGASRRRPHLKCGQCRRQFSVTKSTILEGSRLSLSTWVAVARYLAANGAPLSLAGLERGTGIGRTAARNLMARLAYAAQRSPLAPLLPLDGRGRPVLRLSGLSAEALLTALLATPAPTDPPAGIAAPSLAGPAVDRG